MISPSKWVTCFEKDLNLFGVIDLTTESIHMQWIFDISLHYIEAAA